MDPLYKEIFFVIITSIWIYLFTLYGRNATNKVFDLNINFKYNVEKLAKHIGQELRTNILEHNELQLFLQNILNQNPYISSITILSSRYLSCNCKNNKYEQLNYKVYSDVDKKKYNDLYSEWFTSELLTPKWSHPFYSNEHSDRGFVLHYTTNIIDLENGQADPIINISCSSKLRKRNDLTIVSDLRQ